MKNQIFYKIYLFLCVAFSPFLISWGIFGHEHINRAAVFSLPEPVQSFFFNHIDFITQESTVPDLRKYTMKDKAEAPRHFIDLENFGAIDSLPKTMEELKKKYDEKFLSSNGILPWYLEDMMDKLTKAFKEKRKTEILFIAADLGHYIGDAHMPLHTTNNYDGQLTNQKGIHALWESQLPEIFGKSYNYKCPEAHYIDNIRSEIWKIIFDSHQLVDTMLIADKKLKESFPAKDIYKTDSTGKIIKNKFDQQTFSKAYASQYHKVLKGMVENQARKAIVELSSFWYTAWANSGKPNLSELDPAELTQRNAKLLKKEKKLLEKGELFGLGKEKEF